MPPTTGKKIPPVSVNPGAPVTLGSDVAKPDSTSDPSRAIGSAPGTPGSATGAGTPKSP
jgi:hypothetical protein